MKKQMTDQAIENEIQAKGLTAPRVTPGDIEANIHTEHYFTAEQAVYGYNAWHADSETRVSSVVWQDVPQLAFLSFCVLVLRNGFTVTGESAWASPENFDAEVGRKIARQNAVQKIWPLMDYELKQRLAGNV